MKRLLILIAIGLLILAGGGLLTIHIMIGQEVKENISLAQNKYPGDPEEALISYLLDANNAMYNRTHLAIWTLGQIKSEKALPILKEYYRDDPKGSTCYGKLESMVCQYEIHKALNAIEKKMAVYPQGIEVVCPAFRKSLILIPPLSISTRIIYLLKQQNYGE
ncbi:hypothetical protein LCGC14_2235220 [marine sediment metagenome]|uniref:Uncharacterized protein n=1 Tax=marine sediment metagenome TaxID=412755 RepID=A0A0F9FJM4_9ZZZZ